MKLFDLVQISLKPLKGRWAILLAAGIAVGTFCTCFSGAIFSAVRQEKDQPYELVLSSAGTEKLSDSVILEISKIPGVTAVTGALQIPVSIKTGKYTAQLTLTGVSASYLPNFFSAGGAFPEDSTMPYLVLNDTACRQFSDGETPAVHRPPPVDWLNATFLLQTGAGNPAAASASGKTAVSDDGTKKSASEKSSESAARSNSGKAISAGGGDKTVRSKICGILTQRNSQTEQEAAAYVSLTAAKKLLAKSGQSTDYSAAYVRTANSEEAVSVSKAISEIGIAVTNSNENLRSKWDILLKEARYLAVIAAIGLLYAALAFLFWNKSFCLEQKGALEMLLWLGISRKNLRKLTVVQVLAVSFSGVAAGLAAGLALPSFLPETLMETSSFMLPIPTGAAALSLIAFPAGILLITATAGLKN